MSELVEQEIKTLKEIQRFLNNIWPWDNFDGDQKERLADELASILERLDD